MASETRRPRTLGLGRFDGGSTRARTRYYRAIIPAREISDTAQRSDALVARAYDVGRYRSIRERAGRLRPASVGRRFHVAR